MEKKIILEKPRKIRHKSKSWNINTAFYETNVQIEFLEHMNENQNDENPEILEKMNSEINNKLLSYKAQDKKKNKYDESKFVNNTYIWDLLKKCHYTCFYCNQHVKLLYNEARDPLQWSIERIDNDFGHNNDNVVIACLHCNLSRRTMYHERYKFTKQLKIEKMN
tara:strand:- start:1584 stop:2078 length:495 start_codon:yes stop_codon:yes gene_type:complete